MYLGIDFSGGAAPWRPGRSKPSVWIASVEQTPVLTLIDLRPVQCLPGTAPPFHRLVALLHSGRFAAAAIDAPFSIPARYLPPGGHAALLGRVRDLPPPPDRPFARGKTLLAIAAETAPFDEKKPYRDTERDWIGRGVTTRSTLWNGPRGGAAFTAACLTLLARAERPIWPWHTGAGMLVEAFPAAQLQSWGLPHCGYGKPEQHEARERILAGLAERLVIGPEWTEKMRGSPDALDAVIASFGAIAAVRQGRPGGHPEDGLIAVAE